MIRKLGLVLECDAGGPDETVFRCLVRRLSPPTEVFVATMGSKSGVLLRGAEAARELVRINGCDLVLVVWDFKPPWEGPPVAKRCEDEVAEMVKTLSPLAPSVRPKVKLLCLVHEIETWLITEERAVREYLSTAAHKNKFRSPAKPLSKSNPKAILSAAFKSFRGTRYEDFREAIRLVRIWPDTRKIGKLDSFQRFAFLLTGKDAAEFQDCGDVCDDLAFKAGQLGRA